MFCARPPERARRTPTILRAGPRARAQNAPRSAFGAPCGHAGHPPDASTRPGARRPREPQVGAPAPLRRDHGPSPVVRIAGWSSLGLPPRPPRAMPLVEVFAALMKLHAVAAVRQRHTIKCQKEEDRRIQDPILDLALEAVRTGRAPLQACYRVARSLHRQEALCDERRWAGYLSVACLGQPSHLRVCDRYP